jgi:hypothetical protein
MGSNVQAVLSRTTTAINGRRRFVRFVFGVCTEKSCISDPSVHFHLLFLSMLLRQPPICCHPASLPQCPPTYSLHQIEAIIICSHFSPGQSTPTITSSAMQDVAVVFPQSTVVPHPVISPSVVASPPTARSSTVRHRHPVCHRPAACLAIHLLSTQPSLSPSLSPSLLPQSSSV